MGTASILLVEDELLIRMALSDALRNDGFTVAEAGSGEEALRMLDARDEIALLMTDIQLPGTIDGGALARAARQHRPGLKVIFMSGRPEPPGNDRRPGDMFLAKPFKPAAMSAAARRLLAQ